MNGPSWRFNGSRTRLTAAEARALAALESTLLDADPRLARRLRRFGTRGRVARFAALCVFSTVSLAMVAGLAMITPALAVLFGPPICVFVGTVVGRVYDGPRARRRRAVT